MELIFLEEKDVGPILHAAGKGPVRADGNGIGVGGKPVVVVPGKRISQCRSPNGGVVCAPHSVVGGTDYLEIWNLPLNGDLRGAVPGGKAVIVEREGVPLNLPYNDFFVVFGDGCTGNFNRLVFLKQVFQFGCRDSFCPTGACKLLDG